MKPRNPRYTYLAVAFFFLALLVRVWGIGAFGGLQGDDREFVPKAKLYIEHGQFSNILWYHPPLGSIFLYGSISLLGDNPYGWRMNNILMGAGAVLLVFLIGARLFESLDVAALGALLLLFDPLHLFFSRTTFEEVQATTLFLAALYFLLLYLKGSTYGAPAAGIFLGMSLATKWYFGPAAIVLVVLTVVEKWRQGERSPTGVALPLTSLVLLPFAVYVLTFIPWFGRGYDLSELLTIHLHAWGRSQGLYLDRFSGRLAQGFVPPYAWFLRPILSGFRINFDGWNSQYVVFMNDFPWNLLTIPALVVLARRSKRALGGRQPGILLVALFLATYVPFVLARRPIFLYSLLSLAPLAALAISGAYVQLTEPLGRRKWTLGGAAVAVTVVGLYLYPLVTMRHIPEMFYRSLLSLGSIIR